MLCQQGLLLSNVYSKIQFMSCHTIFETNSTDTNDIIMMQSHDV